MEQHLFILLFFTGVVPLVLSVPRKYYLIQQGKTWSDAQAYCRATHTDLAIIQSNDNMIRLQNEVQRQQFSSSAWIGMYYDIKNWRWSLGNEPLGSMRPWQPGDPDNYGGVEWCGGICSGGWIDMNCISQYPFVCFDDTKTGTNRYIIISTRMSWYGAQAYCRTHYTDLASSRDATENSVIMGLIPGYSWFGLFREYWMWTDKTNFSTISWMSGQPNNALGNENCGYLNNYQAADARCSDIMPFFCYRVIRGQQQIMRVKVGSTQDVNDPAVKAAILEQIKQKLKDHGMAENSTVTWREKPDGKVFHKEKENNTAENKEKSCQNVSRAGLKNVWP